MRCRLCQQDKPSESFYKSDRRTCKDCIKAATRKNRAARIEHYRQYDRLRATLPHRMANIARVVSRWKALNPKRRTAQVAVGNAVRDGKLLPEPCFICGKQAEAHHPDYDQPLDVVWLCPPHHKQTHALARS